MDLTTLSHVGGWIASLAVVVSGYFIKRLIETTTLEVREFRRDFVSHKEEILQRVTALETSLQQRPQDVGSLQPFPKILR